MQDLTGIGQALESEVAKKFYEDALSPGSKRLGLLLRDSMQAIRLATFPIQCMAILQDRLDKFLESVTEKVPAENLTQPPPEVAGPILQALLFVRDENPLRGMFAELLARACDKTREGDAHPAFSNIIHQLSPDEAVILQSIKTYAGNIQLRPEPRGVHMSVHIKNSPGLQELIAPQHIRMYLDHLVALNVFAEAWTFPNDAGVLGLSGDFRSFGILFMDACVPGDWPNAFTEEMRAAIGSKVADK